MVCPHNIQSLEFRWPCITITSQNLDSLGLPTSQSLDGLPTFQISYPRSLAFQPFDRVDQTRASSVCRLIHGHRLQIGCLHARDVPRPSFGSGE